MSGSIERHGGTSVFVCNQLHSVAQLLKVDFEKLLQQEDSK